MKTVIIIILFCLVILGVSVLFALYFFGAFNKRLNAALIKACREDDVRKVIRLLQLGADPNTTIVVEESDGADADLSILDQSYHLGRIKVAYPLLDMYYSDAVKKLLRAYGGKTKGELDAERAALEEALRAEEERMRPIREAQNKAKKEEKMKIVDQFLSSKGLI